MFKKLLIKIFHVFLLLILLSFILLLLVNVFSAKFLELYLSKLTGISVKIRKVERILLPLSFKVSGVTVKSRDFEANVEDFSLKTDLKNFFREKKRFLIVSGKGINLKTFKEKSSNKQIDFSQIYKLALLKKLDLQNVSFELSDKKVLIKKLTLDCEKCFLFKASDALLITKGDRFGLNLFIRGKFEQNGLIVERGIVRGDGIEGSVKGKFEGKNYRSLFKFVIDNRLLRFFNNKLTGQIYINGEVENGEAKFSVLTKGCKYEGKKVDVKSDGVSDFKTCKLQIKRFFCDGHLFEGDLKTDFKTAFLNLKVLSDLYLFKDNAVSFELESAKIFYDFFTNRGKLNLSVSGGEKYKAVAQFVRKNDEVEFPHVIIKSKSLELSGAAKSNIKNSFEITLRGDVKDNPEILRLLNFRHFAYVDVYLKLRGSDLLVKGLFKGKEGTVYSNLEIDKYEGDFSYKDKTFKFDLSSVIDGGNVEVEGELGKKGEAVYQIRIVDLPFQNVLKYFNVDTDQRFLVTGFVSISNSKKKLSAMGEIEGDIFNENVKVLFSYADKKLSFEKLVFRNYRFQNVGYLDFQRKKIRLRGENRFFKYRYKNIEFEGINFFVNGELSKPFLIFSTKLTYKNRNFDLAVSGKWNRLAARIRGDGVNADFVVYDLKKGDGVIGLNRFTPVHDLKVSTFLKVTFDEKRASLKSDKIILLYKKERMNIKNFAGEFYDGKLHILSAMLNGGYAKNIKVVKGYFDKDGFQINVAEGELFYEDYVNVKVDGKLEIDGDYTGDISLYGGLFGFGKLIVKDIDTDFDITGINISFFGKKIRGYLVAKNLDSNVRISFWSDNFKDIFSYGFNMTGENVFLAKSGFMGTVNFDVRKKSAEKLVKGEVFVIHSIFDYRKVSMSGQNGEIKVDIPLDLDIKISSVSPVKLKGEFVNANAAVNLNLKVVDKKMFLQGKIESIESYLMLANEKFYVEEGVLRFYADKKPYLYTRIQGSGKLRDMVVVVKGYLPDYTIEIEDFSPNGRDTVFNKAQSKSKNAVSSFFSGSLLRELTTYTERMLGINRITLEETSVVGSKIKDYFEIGRKFSDRFEVKYLIDMDGEGTNYVVGEYILFDWLRFDVIYSSQEGTGAGITFFADF